ncbi:MAG: GTPase HflX, partial [Chloroflexi bacterium]|nr:GTPase HflX [Chloroflexota bacterium]
MLLDRRGLVQHVMVGDAHSIALPDWGRLRAGRGRLRGLRCLHTHLGNEGLTRDDRTDLLLLRLDAMVTVGMDDDGLPALAHIAALAPAGDRTPDDRDAGIECLDPQPPARIAFDFQDWIREREAVLARRTDTQRIGDREHAVLVSVTAGRSARDLEVHIAELRELAHSAGVDIVDVVTQNRRRVDPKTVLGSGKLEELVIRAFQNDIDLVIVDQDLTATQARNLGERMELRVIDR